MREIVKIIIEKQQETYKNVFLNDPEKCDTKKYHYDWWQFPIHVPEHGNVSKETIKYSINAKDTRDLLNHSEFMSDYISSIKIYLGNIEKKSWAKNKWTIRYAKMLLSLDQFLNVSWKIKDSEKFGKIKKDLAELAEKAIQLAQIEKIDQDLEKDVEDYGNIYKSSLNQLETSLKNIAKIENVKNNLIEDNVIVSKFKK